MRTKEGALDEAYIRKVMGEEYFPSKIKPVIFSGQFLSQFFEESTSESEIRSVIGKALEEYLGVSLSEEI